MEMIYWYFGRPEQNINIMDAIRHHLLSFISRKILSLYFEYSKSVFTDTIGCFDFQVKVYELMRHRKCNQDAAYKMLPSPSN